MGSGFHFEEGMAVFTLEGRDIVVILVVMAAAIALEVFLARKEEAWMGLILPGLRLLQTLVRLAIRVVQVVRTTQEADSAWLTNPWQVLVLAFAVENIPTLILLAVYALCRARMRRRTKRQLERTRIKDL